MFFKGNTSSCDVVVLESSNRWLHTEAHTIAFSFFRARTYFDLAHRNESDTAKSCRFQEVLRFFDCAFKASEAQLQQIKKLCPIDRCFAGIKEAIVQRVSMSLAGSSGL